MGANQESIQIVEDQVRDHTQLLLFTSDFGEAKGGSFQKRETKPVGSGCATLI